ncbi:inositol 1,4,5-trisphosphate receptor-interacting protein-like 1 [Candoia aspera]|uniref:inositol 1,4,5-trisphosphate receptor-interacting protein-like 1 n=1 Tax=Candoia aspera TaxID=51853 RepID=UPI002FD7F52A
MAIGPLIFLAVVALVHHPLMVSDINDSATRDRLREREVRLTREMGLLQVELDQENWDWDPGQSQEQWSSGERTPEGGTWDGWPYVGLVLLLLFGCCRRTTEQEPGYASSTDSSSSSSEGDEDTDLEPAYYDSKRRLLEDFYYHRVETEGSGMSSLCDFVEAFVNNLLEGSRNALPSQNTLPLLENCIGVGSAFEGWPVEKVSKAFSVLVPISPPKGHSFHTETSDSQDAPSKHGHISVERDCVCKREKLLGDVVCFLHHPERQLSREEQGGSLLHVLCTRSHLDGEKATQWFRALVSKAWNTLGQKYNLSLTIQQSGKTCRLKLEFPSGKGILIDLLLGVQQGDSLVFLTPQGGKKDHLNGTAWYQSFAVQELLFFKWVGQRAPRDSCHLKCLQVLLFFQASSTPGKKNPVLTDYHYKTSLMHLLLQGPLSSWEPEQIALRLEDILLHMRGALEGKYLQHFLVGNLAFPIRIPLPRSLRSAAPLNLFEPLAQDSSLHAEAMKAFAEVVEQVRALWLAPGE